MKKNHTAILFCLDETGSMTTVKDVTISSFNEFIENQKKVQGTIEFWLQKFNTNYRTTGFIPEKFSILDNVKLSNDNYIPTAMTPLYDAIGHLIDSVGKDFSNRNEEDRPEKIVFVIQTDGEENSSSDYTSQRVKEMIQHQTDTYKWQFIFLGADQNAWISGDKIGINAINTMSYSNTASSNKKMYKSVSDTISKYRDGTVNTVALDDNDIR